MRREEEIYQERLKKSIALTHAGIDPYPQEAVRRVPIARIRKEFPARARKGMAVTIAGRVMGTRIHGGAAFFDIRDASGSFQVLLRRDALGEKMYRLWTEHIDAGDFIAATGPLFLTKKSEETLEAKRVRFLSKSLRSVPAEWYGLKDVEERFRKRYLDVLLNENLRARFLLRSRVIELLRAHLVSEGFLEVETPMLQPLPGGATAKPFATHLNALNMDLYLRVAPELYLKQVLVAGFEKVFEMGKNFRNEGMDAAHNPEFTMLEFYWAYQDAQGLMRFTETMLAKIAKAMRKNKKEADAGGMRFTAPFARISFDAALKKYAGIDAANATNKKLAAVAAELGIEGAANHTSGDLLDAIFKKAALPHFLQPTFLTGHPLALSPLAKEDPQHRGRASRFQLIAGGMEIVNAYAELNDPIEQRRRFEEQEKARKAGSGGSQRLDENFLEALEYGMPPAAGFGMGVDRFVMLLGGAPSIRETILFPTMRPKPQAKDRE